MLARWDNVGIQVRKSNCEYMQKSVTHLRHWIDQHGIHPLKKKVRAVQEAPAPKNMLVQSNPDLKLVLMCDASSHGRGTVLAHRMQDGTE